MGRRQLRTAQVIAPFGPGSLYTDSDGTPLVVCGLDFWYKRSDVTKGMVACEDESEFEWFEPRLGSILGVSRFRLPPDYRRAQRGKEPPPNLGLHLPSLRFPAWHRHTGTGELRRFDSHLSRLPRATKGRWQPVRFVSVCKAGHLSEFPWAEWIDCACAGNPQLFLSDRGGPDLSSISVECKGCGKRRSLSGATQLPDEGSKRVLGQSRGVMCAGGRPWLGELTGSACDSPAAGALINQVNLHFARTLSALTLPELQEENAEVLRLRNECQTHAGITFVSMMWQTGGRTAARDAMMAYLLDSGSEANADEVERALESLFSNDRYTVEGEPAPAVADSALLAFRRAEYNVIRRGIDDDLRSPNLRVVPSSPPERYSRWIEGVQLVERLRETRVVYGFDRLEPATNPLAEMPYSAMRQLFQHPPAQQAEWWLPAVPVFGEGIFIQLNEEQIRCWQDENAEWLQRRLKDDFIERVRELHQVFAPAIADWRWCSRFLLVHTLAHVLINQLVFEAGYGTAALRERIYVSEDANAPMASFLIYTAAGDSEGTLGGLVRLGLPERLELMLDRALVRAAWCSADPVCSENTGGNGARLANLAACHSCVLLPETACETINHGLDRALIVGTPRNPSRGAFSQYVREAVAVQ